VSDSTKLSTVVLRPISQASADAILIGQLPPDVAVAADFPTEFSVGVAGNVGTASPLGPSFIHRAVDDVAVGEIGGGFVAPGTVIGRARANPEITLIIAHTPLDRPASGRVLTKAGFTLVGEDR
jgi:hypothetical protein